jgi:Ala-tRNA(Pro) deacylase
MAIAITVSDYLESRGVKYDVVSHEYTESALQSAVTAGIPSRQMAKAVVLEDHEGKRLLAVLPSQNKIRLRHLGETLGRDLHMVQEERLEHSFQDCSPGAIPAIGHAYSMEVVYDDALTDQRELYFEAGDHHQLIHLTREDFLELMENGRHCRFSSPPMRDYGSRSYETGS